VITESRDLAEYFEAACAHTSNYKAASNWVMGPVKSVLNEKNLTAEKFQVKPETLAAVIALIDSGKVSYTMASQRLFPELVHYSDALPEEVAQQLNLIQDSSTDSILPIVEQVLKEFPLKVEEFKNGKKGIVTMFMGEVMKRSKGKADPKLATELINKKLAEAKV
jgi:aspartyl-tRNA(Asn)/glutamyl-tRNA(Gln) amidotransferase subunit B